MGEKINWQIGEMVGAGAFGRVYLGLNNDTGQLMAVKQVRSRSGNSFFQGFLAANRALKSKQVTEQSGTSPVHRVPTKQMDNWLHRTIS